MTARITRRTLAPHYFPARHTGVSARRLQGHDAGPTDAFWVGLSVYEPDGFAEQSPTSQETVYVVLDGEFTLSVTEAGDTVVDVLQVGDSVHLPQGTVRAIRNTGRGEARLLVIVGQ